MARVTTITSFDKALKVDGGQVTAQQLLNGRMYLKTTGWSKIKLSEEFRTELIDTLVYDIIGGHAHTKETIKRTLMYHSPKHWALDRMFISKYKKKPARMSYCAGQDATYELRQLRESLK